MALKILVIGSQGHDRADCLDWMQPFPNIEEYDAVILNLTSLSQPLFDSMVRTKAGQLVNLRAPMMTLMGNGKSVYCLTTFYLAPTRPPGSGEPWTTVPPSNYDWMVVKPQLQLNEGQSVSEISEKEFEEYFKFVGKWGIEILGLANSPGLQARGALGLAASPVSDLLGVPSEKLPRVLMRPLCTNKGGKMIAAKVVLSQQGSGGIYLLPPPTKCSSEDGIELIIDTIVGHKSRVRPPWWFRVGLPGLSELERKLREADANIERINEEIAEIQSQKVAVESYRDVLSEDGEALVQAVGRALADLGIETKPTKPGFPMDLLQERRVAVGVTGVADEVDSDTDKVFQITRFSDKHRRGEKLVLVANTHRRIAPDKRKGLTDFTPEVKDFLKLKRVSALTTMTLFEIWKSTKEGKTKSKKAKKLILGTNGVIENR